MGRDMNKYLCFIFSLVTLSGCLASEKMGRPDIYSSIRRILIVPVEPPPLTMTPAIFDAWPASSADAYTGSLYPPTAAGALFIISGIVAIARLPQYDKLREKALTTLGDWYASDQSWVPTRVLCYESANLISSSRSYEIIVRQELYTPSSLKSREVTWTMENWYAPLRKWYNREEPALSPEEYKQKDIDAVLEVGIINYELITGNILSIQVFTKLINVATGIVEARDRCYTQINVGPPYELFKNQGHRFKKIFKEVGESLLECNLKKIGLIPQP